MEKRKEYDAEKLADLLAEVKAATGPDRDLDCAIEKWLYDSGRNFYGHLEFVPTFTASIDAALALVGRMLPGWVCDTLGEDAVGRLGEMQGMGWTAEFSNGLNSTQGQAVTLPLAILAALLSALSALPNTQGKAST